MDLDIAQLQSLLNKNGSHFLRRNEEEDLLIESRFITPLICLLLTSTNLMIN